MKRTIFLTLLLVLIPIFAANAGSNYEMLMTPVNEAPDDLELPSRGNRTTPIKIRCIINENGIVLINISDDIQTYEIYDTKDNCLAVFSDEDSFVEFLFTLSGEYQIRFSTATYDLVGYIFI